MDPSTLTLAAGGVLALFALFGNSSKKADPPMEAIILGGTKDPEYSTAIGAIEAAVSPYDQDVLVIYYNDSQSASDPVLREDINAAATEAAVKGIVHVYGPANGMPAARHYAQGAIVEDLEAGTGPDAVVDWVEAKGQASAGRKVLASSGRKVLASSGRKVLASSGRGGKHMAAMHASSTRGNRGHVHQRPRRTVQARARRR